MIKPVSKMVQYPSQICISWRRA